MSDSRTGDDSSGDFGTICLEDCLRARREGAFVSPCGTEGARWEGFPEWPEPFPYDAFGSEPDDPAK